MLAPVHSSSTQGFFQDVPVVLPAYTSSTLDSTHSTPSDDPIIARTTSLYFPQPTPQRVREHLHDISRTAINHSTLEHCVTAENTPPTLSPFTTFGSLNQSPSQLRTSPSWQYLKALQTSHGILANGYPSETPAYNVRIYQFLLSHIFDPSSAMVSCPAAMTDGAAKLLSSQLQNDSSLKAPTTLGLPSGPSSDDVRQRVFRDAYQRLTSSDPGYAWTAGQWMTERSGGSDVQGTETIATLLSNPDATALDTNGLPLGPWSVSGFKWFSSATDANCVVLLAKTPSRPNGELSCFFAPLHRRSHTTQQSSLPRSLLMNGVRIIRLKHKLGTRALPTAELELTGMRAWLIGNEGEGVKAISAVLNITRLHTAKGSIAAWGRGLVIARAWTRVRKIKDSSGDRRSAKVLLSENRQHVRWMANEAVKYRAMAALCYFGVALLGFSEHIHLLNPAQSHSDNPSITRAQRLNLIPTNKPAIEALLRIITPLAKSSCSLAAVHGLRECMECLGGVGYCENDDAADAALPTDHDAAATGEQSLEPQPGILNLARLYRDTSVNPIWEGTASVLAEDLLRALGIGARSKHAAAVAQPTKVLEQTIGSWLQNAVFASDTMTAVFKDEVQIVKQMYAKLETMLRTKSEEQLLWQGRAVVKIFTDLICAVLLMADAVSDGDEVAVAVARRWVKMAAGTDGESEDENWREEVKMDQRIFLGDGEGVAVRSWKL